MEWVVMYEFIVNQYIKESPKYIKGKSPIAFQSLADQQQDWIDTEDVWNS